MNPRAFLECTWLTLGADSPPNLGVFTPTYDAPTPGRTLQVAGAAYQRPRVYRFPHPMINRLTGHSVLQGGGGSTF